ncbi:MAG: hypothetical protein IK093_08665, partial [Ruminiclostridium sp.]|nr:hypothetical protein [Ruminiclostridium sp.]
NDKKAYQNAIAHAVKEYLATKDCYEGAYYVAIDDNYRVVCAYWCSDTTEIKSGHTPLTKDCTLESGELLCSYPIEYCDAKSVMFIS